MNPQEQHEYDLAVQKGHQHFYEHIPIFKPQLLDLLNAIKKKKPDLIVVGGSRQMGYYIDNMILHTYRALDLAYANLPTQVVGSIGFDGESYSVTSRLIENAKYSAWNSYDHHTKKSKHMNNIVKEAVKYLLPTQFREVVMESVGGIDRAIHNIREKSRESIIGKLRHFGYDAWRQELLHMASVGYKPENRDIADAMNHMVATKEDYDAHARYDPTKMFVWVKPDSVMYGYEKGEVGEVKSTDGLPEDMRGKLFVLMVADVGTFIQDVGMKASDNKFWVLV